jgi:hypothetical protein
VGLDKRTRTPTSITVAWSAASGEGQVEYWKLQYQESKTVSWEKTDPELLPKATTEYTITGLTPGMEYTVQVYSSSYGKLSADAPSIEITTGKSHPSKSLLVKSHLSKSLLVSHIHQNHYWLVTSI